MTYPEWTWRSGEIQTTRSSANRIMLRTQQIQLYEVPTVHLHIFKRLFYQKSAQGPKMPAVTRVHIGWRWLMFLLPNKSNLKTAQLDALTLAPGFALIKDELGFKKKNLNVKVYFSRVVFRFKFSFCCVCWFWLINSVYIV